MTTVFIFTKLRQGVNPKEYEDWVRNVDYPTCNKTFKSAKKFIVFRINEDSKKDSPYDYIEKVDLTSIEEYEGDLKKDEFKKLSSQWSKFIESSILVYSEPIE